MNDSITYMTTAVLIASYNSPIIGKVVSRINKNECVGCIAPPLMVYARAHNRKGHAYEISGLPLTSARLMEK